jgi:hypothetical protein
MALPALSPVGLLCVLSVYMDGLMRIFSAGPEVFSIVPPDSSQAMPIPLPSSILAQTATGNNERNKTNKIQHVKQLQGLARLSRSLSTSCAFRFRCNSSGLKQKSTSFGWPPVCWSIRRPSVRSSVQMSSRPSSCPSARPSFRLPTHPSVFLLARSSARWTD